nr:unnamed protein product [Callosobruchus chinensis]
MYSYAYRLNDEYDNYISPSRHYVVRDTPERSYRTSEQNYSYSYNSNGPSRQVRVLPGLGKVHVSYSYDRYTPYVGHKRLTVVTPPRVYATRPAVLQKEFERIENKLRPWYAYSATNRYLNSDSAVRTYYHVSYPTSYYGFYDSINLPSSPYLPKTYRWYYSWPRQYSSYWRYYYPSFSYYWPSYRPYLSSYLRSLYFNDYWPSSTYWNSYWPYYRSVDYEFSDLEDKIRNLSMIKLRYDPYYGNRVLYYPESRFYNDDTMGRFWSPKFAFSRLPRYWPIYMMDLWATEHHMRQIRMLQIKYYPGEGYNLQYMPDYRFYCDEKILRPLSSYYDYPFRTRVWVPYGKWRMPLKIKYDPVHGFDYVNNFMDPFIPDYRVHRSYDFYDWPMRLRIWYPNRHFRRYINREFGVISQKLLFLIHTSCISSKSAVPFTMLGRIENRFDPFLGHGYTYWPDSKYFRNYRFSPPISVWDDWSYRSRVWFPYYWSTRRLFNHYMDYHPSDKSIRELRVYNNFQKNIYLDYPYPIRAVDYSYYPRTYRHYRPLTLYYDYYWPISSLNRYSSYWPYYPYYRYLYYKYTLPSDRYYHLKGNMTYLRDPYRIRWTEYRIVCTPPLWRHRVYKPLSLYYDYYYPIRYVPISTFHNQINEGQGWRLQKIFDDETRLIRAQTASLLRRIHDPVPRVKYTWPTPCPSNRRSHLFLYEDPMRNDIQLLSFYINKFKQEKAMSGGAPAIEQTKVPLSPARPSRKFTANKQEDDDTAKEMQKMREARAARMDFLEQQAKQERHLDISSETTASPKKQRKEEQKTMEEQEKKREEERRNDKERKREEERRIAEERKKAQAKKEEAERKAEQARQEELAAKAAAERAADLERQAELLRQEELAKQAELEQMRKDEEERHRLEEEKRIQDELKAEEERKQLARLEELAKQAEEEREAELARQAEEQEAELAELERKEKELAEQASREAEAAKQEAELAELARQEAELAELERQQAELDALEAEAKALEADFAEETTEQVEAANTDAELTEEDAELAELERQQAALDALEAEAKALDADFGPEKAEEDNADERKAELAKQEAELEELARQEADEAPTEDDDDEDARKQREMDELIQQKFELAELERQQAELDALEAEAKAMAEPQNNSDDFDEPAIAEDTPLGSDAEE